MAYHGEKQPIGRSWMTDISQCCIVDLSGIMYLFYTFGWIVKDSLSRHQAI